MTTLVIGGGVAGAAAAHVCLDAEVYEATARVGGRMATRVHDGTMYDLVAGHIRDAGDERSALVRETLGADCATVDGRVERFDADGRLHRGPEDQPARLTGRHGIRQVPIRLLASAGCDLHADTAVEQLERVGDGWRAHTEAGLVEADRVVATAKPERMASLLAAPSLATDLRAAADRLDWQTLDSVVLGYDHPVDRDWYGLLDASGEHAVRRLLRESAKPDRVPEGRAALVVQLRADGDPEASAVHRARRAAADLLGDGRLRDPAWTDHERYRFAAPRTRTDDGLVARAAETDLHLAGGWTAGMNRTFAALETGLDAGRRAMGMHRQAAVQPDGPVEW
jgi:renalase